MLDKIQFVGGTEEQNNAMKDQFIAYAAKREEEEKRKAEKRALRESKPRIKNPLEDHPRYAEKIALYNEVDSLKKAIKKNQKKSSDIIVKEHNPTFDNHKEVMEEAFKTCPRLIKLYQEATELFEKYNAAAVKFNAIKLD